MSTLDRFLITNPNAVHDGKQYVEVLPYNQRLTWRVITVHGKPFLPSSETLRAAGALFVGVSHTTPGAGAIRMRLSLHDCNVIPNSYNMSSLWEYQQAVIQWLTSLQQRGPEGFPEYVAALKRHDRASTINANAKNEYAFW